MKSFAWDWAVGYFSGLSLDGWFSHVVFVCFIVNLSSINFCLQSSLKPESERTPLRMCFCLGIEALETKFWIGLV